MRRSEAQLPNVDIVWWQMALIPLVMELVHEGNRTDIIKVKTQQECLWFTGPSSTCFGLAPGTLAKLSS